jgi:hypothetical protein
MRDRFPLAQAVCKFDLACRLYGGNPQNRWRLWLYTDTRDEVIEIDRTRARLGIPRAALEEDPFPVTGMRM